MDIYHDCIRSLMERPESQQWPDLHNALDRALKQKPVAWHFPIRACETQGSPTSQAIPAVAAITCIHMAIMLVDDVLDEDPRGAYHQLGNGKTANLAVELNALGLAILMESSHPETATILNRMIAQTAIGQNLDVSNIRDEASYWQVTRLKSSPYFGAALCIGAVFGGASVTQAENIRQFGELYGEVMQIHDDLNDSLAVPANVDWLSGRSPLPLLFAELVDHPDREHFMELRKQVDDPDALTEAQQILVRCGAISYSVQELILRHQRATRMLDQLELANPKPFSELLDEGIAPVRHLLSKIGADAEEIRY